MSSKIAHKIEKHILSDDVNIKDNTPFSRMCLKEGLKKGLAKCFFKYPTIIQANAIPLGKGGTDLLIEAKSGTGKTLIYCIVILELFKEAIREPQSLILVPTREIAIQVEDILNKLGQFVPNFRAITLIGGLDWTHDRKKLASARAIVGTPGRVLHLIQNEMLNTSKISLLILDEVDKFFSQTFFEDFEKIYKSLPAKKQIISCSATLCEELQQELSFYMNNIVFITAQKGETNLSAVKQFVFEFPEQHISILEMELKLKKLNQIFGHFNFVQCLIFAGSQSRAESYKYCLEKKGWPCEFISGAQEQKVRNEIFRKFKNFGTHILFCTDLMARGIDSENVNLVINMEPPIDGTTYLHRIGRAGRFGSSGIAITFLHSQKEVDNFEQIVKSVGVGLNLFKYDHKIPDIWNFEKLEKDNILEIYDFNKGIEYIEELKKDLIKEVNGSSTDCKTYKIEYVEPDSNANKIMLTETMSNLQRPSSSNTIDDASSIAVDSDVLRSNSMESREVKIKRKMNNNNSMSLLEVLIDNSKSSSTEQIDLFEDYKLFDGNLNEKNKYKPKTELNLNSLKAKILKDLVVDQRKPNKPAKDAFSEYQKAKDTNDDLSDSNSFSVTLSQQYEKLSEAGPSTSSRMPNQFNLKIATKTATDSIQSTEEAKKHFPSPNVLEAFMIENPIPLLLQPRNDVNSSNNSVASLTVSSSFEGVSTSSSGFDERITSVKTSGISSSTNTDIDSDSNYEEEEEDETYDESDESNDSEDSDDDDDDDDDEEYETSGSDTEKETKEIDEKDRTDNATANNTNISNATNIPNNSVKSNSTTTQNNPLNSERFHQLQRELRNTHLNNDQQNTHSNLDHSSEHHTFLYQNSYTRWMDLYWNQFTRIQDYVKFCTYVKYNANL